MGINGTPRPVPSSLASWPSPRRVWVTKCPAVGSLPPLRRLGGVALMVFASSGIKAPSHSASVPSPPPPLVRALIVGATPSPAPRLGAGCQRLLSMIGSSASAAAHLPAPPLASTKTRFRRWARPKCWASRTRHAATRVGPSTTPALGHPSSGSSMGSSRPHRPPRKAPKALSLVLKTPGTFSQRIQAGSLPAVDRRSSIASPRSTN